MLERELSSSDIWSDKDQENLKLLEPLSRGKLRLYHLIPIMPAARPTFCFPSYKS